MAERRCSQMLFVILMLLLTVTEQLSSVPVRVGDDVTLPCESVYARQGGCQTTVWLFKDPDNNRTEVLVGRGQIQTSRSDKQTCSLVINKVTVHDVGVYSCRYSLSQVYLSVVYMDEYKLDGKIYFYCYVSTHRDCEPSVKWLHQGEDVFTDHSDVKASEKLYYATVSPLDSYRVNSSLLNSLMCEVTDCRSNVRQFPLRPQVSDKDAKPATTESTASAENSLTMLIHEASPETQGWWRTVIVSVGLTTLIIIVVTVHVWIRTKGNKTQMNQTTADEDEDDEGTAIYENAGASASV